MSGDYEPDERGHAQWHENEPPEGEEVHCRYCKEGGLEWVNTGMRWRLVDADAKFHECRGDVANADDF